MKTAKRVLIGTCLQDGALHNPKRDEWSLQLAKLKVGAWGLSLRILEYSIFQWCKAEKEEDNKVFF